MILATALLAAATAAPPARILAVSTGALPGGASLTVLTAGDPGEVSVRREGDEVVVQLGATAPAGMAAPGATPPLESLRIERTPRGVLLHVRVPRGVAYQLRREAATLTVVFGQVPAAQPAPTPEPAVGVAELYRRILPASSQEAELPGEQVAAPVAEATAAKPGDGVAEAWTLGTLRLRPSVSASYVRAEAALLDTPTPIRDEYYQVEPRFSAELPLATGLLSGAYSARLRRGSSFEQVRETSHLFDGNLDLPLGTSLALRGSGHFAQGVLEATEVDPGGEYFFRLGRFTRKAATAGLRFETGGRLDLDVEAALNRVQVGPEAGFFDYETQTAGASLGYDMGANVRSALGYTYESVPTPGERPEARSQAHFVYVSLRGEIVALVKADLQIGYRDQRSPRAGTGGTRYRGAAGSLRLTKEFTRGSRLELSGSRSTPLSAFEDNGFYIASSAEAELIFQLPLSFSARGAAGYHWNDYRTVAAGLGRPRQDRILGWSAGLGRPITRWAFLRADYRRDRRNSNLDFFDVTTEGLTVQLGIGLFGTADHRR